MNLSGEAVRDIKQFYKVNPEHILIVYDDIDLPFGTVKLRKKGSGGTHNGMKSIIQLTGSGAFPRVRVGIGPKPLKMDLAAFVLQSFGPEENHELPAILDHSVKAIDYGFGTIRPNLWNVKPPERKKRKRRLREDG